MDPDNDWRSWQGAIGTRVAILERHDSSQGENLDRMRMELGVIREDVAVMRVRLTDQAKKLEEITVALDRGREQDLSDLHDTIERSRASTRNLLIYLLAPLFVLVLGGLILFTLIGTTIPGH